jgi:uncharacterized protein YjbI with pentapeptide repeats
MMRRSIRSATLLVLVFGLAATAIAEPMTVKQISQILFKAAPGSPPDLAHADLGGLDLSELDFKGANLAGADLYGANLSRANLAGTDLSGASLDHTIITTTNFAGANLEKATLYGIAAYSTLDAMTRSEAPSFEGANLSGALIMSPLARVNFRGANMSHLKTQQGRARLEWILWSDFSGSDFTGADLSYAELPQAKLRFAKLVNAKLAGALLAGADLSRADLTGADLTGAELTGADLDGAILKGVIGLDQAEGLDAAKNRDRAIY